ncbi:T9SS type A sorting domain-containing protein [Rhodocytophaga rosea]|uniref:T9SS type A sorting domain-containing protein n=1 Tax=Rhodocytophaga rosea TaxID=2704465 RepID=A0A6C0GGA7_9BACT|nr:T9SS type A sorting domain-containing protein [Rhodocytophaga rosea]QHT66813.1 T9SS type A sorting domain-containing protein [Rhodocytophaga rosea]
MLCFFTFPAAAQLQLYPLQNKATEALQPTSKPQARTQADPLTLPFFDDFSTVYGKPDPARWQGRGGVYINNTAAVNPPSKGVATFDGLDSTGTPRDFSRATIQSPTDTLTSRPINLAGQEAANVYLSFFWQARGIGELPDPTDSLLLEFKTADTTWNSILTITGQNTAEFKQEIIAVPALYCHASFQFRFRLFSRPAGPYDAWHIDYVYLDRNRNATDRYVRDVATVDQPASLLKNFTAMPLVQLQADPTQLKDSVYTSIYNSHSRGVFTTYNFKVENIYNSQVLINSAFPDPSPINSLNRQLKGVRLNQAALLPAVDSLLLKYTFSFNTGDDNATIPSVNLQQNDTISGTTVLHNYYAYDDGTAEYGLGLRQRQGRVACKFYVNTPDTLTSIRLYFTRMESDLKGQTFVLRIWSKLDTARSSVLYEKSIPIRYSDTLNKFIDFPLLPNVLVSDTFYVGWQQSSDDILAIGLDKNTNASSQLYYNISGLWEQNTEIQGSAMIRPVFARVTTVGLPENEETRNFVLYPNPTAGRLTWNDDGVSLIEVYDILGKKVKSQVFQPSSTQELNLSQLNPGMYILYIHFKKYVIARKVMVQR